MCVAARGAAVVTCWQVNNHRKILEDELELVGMRLNKQPPQIQFTKKKTGGIKFNSTVTLTQLGDDPQQAVRLILAECVTAPRPARSRLFADGESLTPSASSASSAETSSSAGAYILTSYLSRADASHIGILPLRHDVL